MILAQANRLDNGELVEGYFYKIITQFNVTNYFIKNLNYKDKFDDKIDSQTLKYSFDNGKTWRSELEMQNILLTYDNLVNEHRKI